MGESELADVIGVVERRGRQHEYLARWAGHDNSEDMWLPESELHHA